MIYRVELLCKRGKTSSFREESNDQRRSDQMGGEYSILAFSIKVTELSTNQDALLAKKFKEYEEKIYSLNRFLGALNAHSAERKFFAENSTAIIKKEDFEKEVYAEKNPDISVENYPFGMDILIEIHHGIRGSYIKRAMEFNGQKTGLPVESYKKEFIPYLNEKLDEKYKDLIQYIEEVYIDDKWDERYPYFN
ncbi:MAG: hypothetical protein GY714_20840 [Desulfobacterales bacterium]|nr:hypothetical protein [Desulfobacterales bacterium]